MAAALLALFLVLFLYNSEGRIVKATKGRVWLQIAIPDATYNILDYGAKGDGKTNDTDAIQKALNAAGSAGGGTVLVPSPNTYLFTCISFAGSNTNLEIEKGATLLVSNNRNTWPGENNIITSGNYDSISITGGGTINGQGSYWWNDTTDFRPTTVYWHTVKNGLISDITVTGCPNHCLELYCGPCEVAGVTVTNPSSTGPAPNSHNTDAVDVHGQPFYIHDCTFNTGDDNVAAHANDTLVENCQFGTGHGASIGSVCNAWLKNITFRNIVFNGTTSGARIKTNQPCVGSIQNVTYQDLTMYNVADTLNVSMFYSRSSDPTTLVIKNIIFKNITAHNTVTEDAGYFDCVSNSPCQGIQLIDVVHDGTTPKPWYCSNAYGTASDVTPTSCLKAQSDYIPREGEN